MIPSPLARVVACASLGVLIFGAIAYGGSSIQGTYTNANGMATLDVKSGGKASFTVMGDTQTCTYKNDATKLPLTCKDQEMFEFTIHEDGPITSIGTFIGTMKKSKS